METDRPAGPSLIGLRQSRPFGIARSLLDTRWLIVLFLICALPTGILLAVLTPMDQVADEQAHIARAAGLSTGQIFGHRAAFLIQNSNRSFPISGVTINSGLLAASESEYPLGPARPLTARRLHAAEAIPWSKDTMFDVCPNTVQYFPFFYLPGTIGLGLGRLIGLSPLDALYAGRVMMLLAYVALGTLALYVTSWGRALMFAVLMMPMAISLGASFNQDGQLIAATALAAALLTKDPATARRQRLIGIVLIVLLICSKPPYGFLLFVGLLPLARPALPGRLVRLSAFAILPLAWVAIMAAISMVTFHRTGYHPGPLWAGAKSRLFHGTSPPDNLRVLLGKPTRFVTMPTELLMHQWAPFLLSAVGVLGWLSVGLAPWQYHGWYIATVCAAIGVVCGRSRWRIGAIDTVFVLILIVVTVYAIAIAQYLSWTAVGAAAIDGVTGRYFLLFLPIIVLGLPRLGYQIDARIGLSGAAALLEGVLAIPALMMAGYDVYGLPSLIVRVFHT